MGNVENKKKYTHLEQLSTKQLEDILRADSELQEGSDLDMVLYIMEVIEKRENGKSLENKADAARALKEFHAMYNTPDGANQSLYPSNTDDNMNLKCSVISTPKTKNHHFLRRLLSSVAAAAVVIIFLLPSTLGYETFYEMVGTWTENVFQFETRGNMDNIDDIWKQELNTYEIPTSVLPTKIPKGFVLQDWKVNEQQMSGDIEFSSLYLRGESFLTISAIRYSRNKSSNIEKDNAEVEKYSVGGITYYLFENLNNHVATWYVDNLECVISGDISTDELKMMIDSIKGRLE